MLGLLPQDFNAVQLGAIRREVEQAQPLSRPPPTAAFDGFRAMDARIVEYHDVRLRADLRAEPIEKGDHIFLSCWSLERAPYQGLVLIKRAEHVDALSMRLWRNRMCLTARGPTVGEWRVRAETGFVIEEQATQSLPSEFG